MNLRTLKKKRLLKSRYIRKYTPFITDVEIYKRSKGSDRPILNDKLVITVEFLYHMPTPIRVMHDFLREVDKICFTNPDVSR